MLIPDWPAPARVHARFSTRAGGVSSGPYASLNLGDHVGDEAAHVAQNRTQFQAALGVRAVFLNQVHGWDGVWLTAGSADGIRADWSATEADQLGALVMVADCLPVLLCDRQGQAVAAAHAGWRGLAGDDSGRGVLESCVQALFDRVGRTGDGLMAWLGPCIGPQRFEVGPEVRQTFMERDAAAARRFVPGVGGRFWADLPGLARDRLARLGVSSVHGNDGTEQWCTVSQDSRFFSHRRDRVSGRMAACIWLD